MARKLWLLARIVLVLSFLLFLRSLHLLTLDEKTKLSSSQNNELSLSSTTRENVVKLSQMPQQNLKNLVEEIIIAVVVCGDRVNETLTMIKSAVLFSHTPVKIIIFADENALTSLKHSAFLMNDNKEDSLNSATMPYYYGRAKLDLRPITFPNDKAEEWKKLFKPCASQRLFLPVG